MKCYTTCEAEHFVEKNIEFELKQAGEMHQVKVYPQITYQEVFGMGGAFTEAAGYAYAQMSDEKKEEIIKLYFGDEGSGYNFCRTHIQSCDFALGNYAYVEDSEDKELKTFTIERDKKYLIPLIKDALGVNKDIALLASPWSPPAFMKTNGQMNKGGKLKKEFYGMWADMMVKYLEEYQKEGINIERLTVQNEPAATQTWDSCVFTASEEAEFAAGYLKPALDKAGQNVKINIWDHNKDIIIDRVLESFSSEAAVNSIDGIAFHWYTGDHFEALQEVRRLFENKELIFTEGCVEYSRFGKDNQVEHAEMYAHDIIGDFNAGMNGFIDWNLLLDEKGGPNHVGNYCSAPIMCDTANDELIINLSYYYIRHFSRFIKAGAKRMLVSKYSPNIEAAGFINPDGEKVVVILNRTDDVQSFDFSGEGRSCSMEIAAHSIMTLCW